MKELGFNTLVELLERVNGVRVMKPPGTELMMVCGPNKKKRGKKEGSGSELTSSSDVSSENESQVVCVCERERRGELTCNNFFYLDTIGTSATWLYGLRLQETSCTNREEDGRCVCDTRPHTELCVCSIDW